MKVLITGASGLIGTELKALLAARGHEPVSLVRCEPSPERNELQWDPVACSIDAGGMEGLDAVVHLAGENLAEGRWSPEKKKRIEESRIDATRLLCESLAALESRPRVLASASAIGYYGDRGGEIITEESAPADDYVGRLCAQWEAATAPARQAGIRVVLLRIGIVLSTKGGALKKMLPTFSLGLGGRIGTGGQYMSWIHIDDTTGAILHTLENPAIEGPVNITAPLPVTNAALTRTLARTLGRPAFMHAPAAAMKLAFGELADAVLLAGARVMPSVLLESGYEFKYNGLEEALRHLIAQKK